MTHLYYLAYLTCKRLGKTSAEFDVWTDSVDGVVVADPKA
jgi:hypothetical protein